MKLSPNYLIKLFLGTLVAIIVFHFCIILKIIPYEITWGGRLKSDAEMYGFETISILINLFLVWILLMKANFVKYQFSERTITTILWVFFTIFILNTIGNIFAKTFLEKLFALLTGFFALLLWKINRPQQIN